MTVRLAYVRTSNDQNGNPRRGWVIWEEGAFRWVEEGFGGNSSLLTALGYDKESYEKGIDWLYSLPAIRVNASLEVYQRCKSGQVHTTWIADELNSGRTAFVRTSGAVA